MGRSCPGNRSSGWVSKFSHGDISGVGMCGELGPLGPDICCGTHGVEFWV
jgi:hypothetical protein